MPNAPTVDSFQDFKNMFDEVFAKTISDENDHDEAYFAPSYAHLARLLNKFAKQARG